MRTLLPGHTWRTRQRCKTMVLDRGAVQFDFPRSWLVEPAPDSVTVFDRRPPADESRLTVSYLRQPAVDWSGLPVADLVDRLTSKPRDNATCGPLREEIRRGIELAWREMFFALPRSPRHVLFRVCVARRAGVICLITHEDWAGARGKKRGRHDDVWLTVLDTLVLDRVVVDPARGPQIE